MISTLNAFLDTNILVYAALGKDKDLKAIKANQLIRSQDFGISGQVLHEFYNAVTTKGGRPLTPDEAFSWVERFAQLPLVPVDAALVMKGIAISVRHRISHWDGAILAAAEALGAETLYTEDLNHGQLYGSVRVVNPFRPE
jgi:predicted nucleic acid-binding protein